MYHGIINVLKSPKLTSHDVVSRLRRILHTKRIGHAGTLDPDAVGVLPVCVGKYTRLVDYLMSDTKVYRALLKFGKETDTEDSSGEVIRTTPLAKITRQDFEKILAEEFVGEINQTPPMYSAIKKDGKPLYELARKGITIERKARKILIHNIIVLEYSPKEALIEVTCGKGTYIRTLCKDIGRAVGSSAYMDFLLRTRVGRFTIEDAVTLEEIEEEKENIEKFIQRPTSEVLNLPRIYLSEKFEKDIVVGKKIPLEFLKEEDLIEGEDYLLCNEQENIIAIAFIEDALLKPKKVFGDRK